jgi:hypothetical protein
MRMASSGRVKKRRLDVPNIAFLDAGILFDILGYSRFDCLHVSGSLIYYNDVSTSVVFNLIVNWPSAISPRPSNWSTPSLYCWYVCIEV